MNAVLISPLLDKAFKDYLLDNLLCLLLLLILPRRRGGVGMTQIWAFVQFKYASCAFTSGLSNMP